MTYQAFIEEKTVADIKAVCSDLITKLGYSPKSSMGIETSNVTYNTLLSEFKLFNMDTPLFRKICLEAATIAELCYSHTSAEVRLYVARFTWYIIYIDDHFQKHPDLLATFQQGIFNLIGSDDQFFDNFRRQLADAYRLWDIVPANGITVSGLEYVNGYLMEQFLSFMPTSPDASRWPDFLRVKTGNGATYAYMIFPKELGIDATAYIQVMDDMSLFISLANDVLSFYKEQLVGDVHNYIHHRATVTNKVVLDALKDTVKEVLDAHERILKVLKNTPAYDPYVKFIDGYMCVQQPLISSHEAEHLLFSHLRDFHLAVSRYRLADLNL